MKQKRHYDEAFKQAAVLLSHGTRLWPDASRRSGGHECEKSTTLEAAVYADGQREGCVEYGGTY